MYLVNCHRNSILCANTRSLTVDEIAAFGPFLPLTVLTGAVLHDGLPAGPYFGGMIAYTVHNDIYLGFGIGPFLSDPYKTGTVGHELYHVWQYELGATPLDFIVYQQMYGHDRSPLEVPAIRFGRGIEECRRGGSC